MERPNPPPWLPPVLVPRDTAPPDMHTYQLRVADALASLTEGQRAAYEAWQHEYLLFSPHNVQLFRRIHTMYAAGATEEPHWNSLSPEATRAFLEATLKVNTLVFREGYCGSVLAEHYDVPKLYVGVAMAVIWHLP